MTKQTEINITDSEWEVMRVIWSQQEATSNFVVDVLKEKKGWQPTTTKTLLSRLVKKDILKAVKEGNRFIYTPLVSETDSWKSASDGLFNHICSKKMGQKIALLIEENPLSFDDLKIIQGALSNKEKEALEEVPCNCIPGQCNCGPNCC